MSAPQHDPDCEYWFEQYQSECTCGVTRPKALWFDEYKRICAEARTADRTEGGNR